MNTPWREAIDSWTTHLRAGGHPPTTIRLRTQHIRQLAAAIDDPWAATAPELASWIASHTWAPATVYSVRSSLRSFYAWAHNGQRIEVNPAEGLPSVRRRPPRPHPLQDAALADALSRSDARTRLMLHLAGRCGLRRGEVARVHADDLHGADGTWSLVVRGKGERSRVVPIADDLAAAVLARGPGWIFPGADEGHLAPDTVGQLASDVLPPGWSLHSLRHRFATRAYAATRDAFSVQALLGHASPATTLAYVQVPDETLRRTMLAAG